MKDVFGRVLLQVNSRKIYGKRRNAAKRSPYMYVIGMPILVCPVISYRRGLFALLILFPGNARSLLVG